MPLLPLAPMLSGRGCLFIGFLFLCSSSLRGGTPLHLSVDNGLSQNSVYCVLQDRQGFIWIGTADGLNRFDGYEVRTFRHDPGDSTTISDNAIRALLMDPGGNLFVGTDKGIDRVDQRLGTFRRVQAGFCDGLYLSPSGRIWATAGWRIVELDPVSGSIKQFKPTFLHQYTRFGTRAICVEPDGDAWLGTTMGLFRYTASTDSLELMNHLLPAEDWSASPSIRSLFLDADGMLWIGREQGGLYILRPGADRVAHMPVTESPGSRARLVVTCATGGEAGELWFGTGHAGLLHRRPGTRDIRKDEYPLPFSGAAPVQNLIQIMRDRSGLLWIATDGDGVYALNLHEPRFPRIEQLTGTFVRSICGDGKGTIWFGTFEHGVIRYREGSGKATTFHDETNPATTAATTVYHLRIDGEGRLWAATVAGLREIDRASGAFRNCNQTRDPSTQPGLVTYYVLVTSRGMIWTGTEGGIQIYDPRQRSYVRTVNKASTAGMLADARVSCLYEDSSGVIWAGTRGGGVTLFDQTGRALGRLAPDPRNPLTISNGNIMGITAATSGDVWITTASGLNRCNTHTRTVRRIGVRDGMPGAYCYAAVVDGNGTTWVSTNAGLAALTWSPAGALAIRSFDVNDGLQSNEFNAQASWKAPDGRLLFGGVNGVNAFYPDQVAENIIAPQVVLTGFRSADWQEWQLPALSLKGDTLLTVDHTVPGVSFQVVGLEYTNAPENRYAYWLEGLEPSWVECGTRRELRFPRLPPGDYVLHVRAGNSDGIWSKEEVLVRITVLPPYWMTWWFRSAGVIALVSVSGASFRWLERRKQQRRIAELQRRHALELERSRISRDMHDEIGSSLTRINLLSEMARSKTSDPQGVDTTLQKISGLSREVIDSLGHIVWALNPGHDSAEDLASYVRAYVVDMLESAGIVVRAELPESVTQGPVSARVRRGVFLVVKEAVHNVIKHSGASEVRILWSCIHDVLEFSLEDNGRGFEPADVIPGGNGLGNMRRRVEDLGGECSITSAPGAGTRVHVRIKNTTNV